MTIYGTYQLEDGTWHTLLTFNTIDDARGKLRLLAQGESYIFLSERLTVRQGDEISVALINWCIEYNVSVSDAIREALSDMLGVGKPVFDGHLKNLKQNRSS